MSWIYEKENEVQRLRELGEEQHADRIEELEREIYE